MKIHFWDGREDDDGRETACGHLISLVNQHTKFIAETSCLSCLKSLSDSWVGSIHYFEAESAKAEDMWHRVIARQHALEKSPCASSSS